MNNQWPSEATIKNRSLHREDTLVPLDTELWEQVEDLAPLQVYPAAVELFRQGSPPQSVYYIERGLVKLILLEEEGGELVIGLRSPGWLLGAASVILQEPYALTAITLTPSYLRRIPARSFIELVKSNAHFSWYLQRMQSRELLDQLARVMQLGCLSARHRLEQLLWQLASDLELGQPQKGAKEVRLNLPLRHREIAELIAVTPAYLSRLFSQMEQEGLLQRSQGWLIVSDPQALWHGSDLNRTTSQDLPWGTLTGITPEPLI